MAKKERQKEVREHTFRVIEDPEPLAVFIGGEKILQLFVVELHMGQAHSIFGCLSVQNLFFEEKETGGVEQQQQRGKETGCLT